MASSAVKQVNSPDFPKIYSSNSLNGDTQITLQQQQTTALLSLLNLNNPVDPTETSASTKGTSTPTLKVPAASGPPVWKVLVLDQYTKDVLATVLRVQDLRDVGVTLHVYMARLFYIINHILTSYTDNCTLYVLL